MKVTVIASTKPGEIVDKNEFNMFSGHAAGVCYMATNFEDILKEDQKKTIKRYQLTQGSGHHSVFDHEYITFYFEGIPKLLAMLLNNEKVYATSEKSARYTRMQPSKEEELLYNKWMEIYKRKIIETYSKIDLKKVDKLAQENARYLISVMTPTTMIYTVSYRQFNYIYGFLKQMTNDPMNELSTLLMPYVNTLMIELEKTGYLEENLIRNNKGRGFTLIEPENYKKEEYFGDVYCTNYKGSFAQLAQAHRHRTLSYSMSLLEDEEYFIPPIIEDDIELVQEWLEDMKKISQFYPQGTMVLINERGTYENFLLKAKERLCTHAQLEICNQTRKILLKYKETLEKSNHYLKDDIAKYTNGARCTFPNFTCTDDCKFGAGKVLVRKI